MKRAAPELAFHKSAARFLDLALPEDAWWSTIPAGGGGRVRGAKLKASGYRAGTPDILIVWQGRAHFLELKAKSGRLSPAQKACHAAIERAGARVATVTGLDWLEGTLIGWGMKLRATVGQEREDILRAYDNSLHRTLLLRRGR